MDDRPMVARSSRHLTSVIVMTSACAIIVAAVWPASRLHADERTPQFSLLPPPVESVTEEPEDLPPAFVPELPADIDDPLPIIELDATASTDELPPLFGARNDDVGELIQRLPITEPPTAAPSTGLELPPIEVAAGPPSDAIPAVGDQPSLSTQPASDLFQPPVYELAERGQGNAKLQPPVDEVIEGVTPDISPVKRIAVPELQQAGPAGFMPTPTSPSLDEMMTNAWWTDYTSRNMRTAMGTRPISINSLIADALKYSAQVQLLSDTPLIRETAILESDAAFDWAAFMETTWYDTNEPVGSTLTTGGPPRFENQLYEYEYGVRKQTARGGRLEVGQRYGYERSNSIFFIPNDQGTSRLTLSYTQPLMRGGGRVYNTGLVVLAQVESGVAQDEFSRELQTHLLEVARGYWALYLERGALVQKKRLLERGKEILSELEHRQVIDAVANQIVRARAAVAARQSDLYRSAAAVKNAEGRIRALVNAPQLGALDEFELMPIDVPTIQEIPVDMAAAMETSFRNRPEIHSSIKQIKAAAVRKNMSKNELLPVLDVVMETYVAGLRGDSSVGGAWSDMFSTGSASYSAGLQFEVPLRNREARARFRRRALEFRQFQNQLRATLHAMQLEVEIAVREVQASYREFMAKYQAMRAAASEVDYIDRRWRLLPGEDRTASLVLEDLLGAQERLTAKEFEFLSAQVTYNLALTNMKRATGTLLQVENIVSSQIEECGIPKTQLYKTGPAANPAGVDDSMYEQVQYTTP